MGIKLWVMLVMMVLSLLNGRYCLGCWEEERIALLQLKENINFPCGESLPSWVVNEIETDCCQWQGVECSNTTKRVIQIILYDARDRNFENWYFNASLFLPFQELRNLSLEMNQLVGWIENEGFDRLSTLRNLEALNLGENSFDRKILSALSQLSSLKHLGLHGCFSEIKNYDNSRERLFGLTKLEVLDFAYNLGIIEDDILSVLNLNDFINLKELDLSYNEFRSLGTTYGLKYLRVLNLQSNHFNNSIFSSLHRLSSLKSLDLSFNGIKGTVQIRDLRALSNLEELDLSGNKVDNFTTLTGIKSMHSLQVLKLDSLYVSNISNMVQSLRAFAYLKHFYFRYNYVNGSIGSYDLSHLRRLEGLFLDNSIVDWNFLQSIGALTSLKILSLSNCGLNGTLLVQGLCELKKLQELDLSWNEYEGILPSCVANMTSLRLVELSHNTFTGNIASPPLSKLTSLEFLSISSNNFQVPISFKAFFNHSNFKFLFLDNNEIIDDNELGNWVPNFQLEVFSMSNSRGPPSLPHFLYYQSNLRFLDLSNNSIGPNFPTWLLENNTRLWGLNLRDNVFIGPLKLPTSTNPNMESFDVSNNKFNGHVPTNITSIFPNLVGLIISTNMFDGCVPSFGDLKSIEYIDLSSNNLSGTIPQEVVMGCFSLYFLKFSDNKLQGQIFPESINLQYLRYLYLDNNEFSGTIPKSLSTIDLSTLDISNNCLSGRIPTSVGNMTTLREISLSNNQLEGPIPEEICNLDLYLLDLSENKLCGSVPSCFNPSRMDHVYLNNNQLEGELPYAFYNCSYLKLLDLRHNKFIGGIPHWIGNLSMLSIILLGGNHFEGTIPYQFCEMDQLRMIDLSLNFLSGQIPPCLGNVTMKNSELFGGPFFIYSRKISSYVHKVMLERAYHITFERSLYSELTGSLDFMPITATFMTKRNYYTYKGSILNYMSGIDLSSNKLHGEIPDGLGNLSEIHSLNLSHNYLIGTIPETFSNLHQIESLDLSYNNLGGRIPIGLIKLNNLAVFNVAHNNLTGMIPEKFQFGTFDEDSYQGNPYLCGHPLRVDCTSTGSTPVLPFADDESEERCFMDMEFFYISFIVSYLCVVICIATVLSINSHWRKAWFHFIEVYIIHF
ncbi:LRR receptor-like serine threonine- kinase GSO1 [Olea europaea subsp. europaea]|uniref:LRR receptor-like serine threonine- kinase GSO1 n=1 Tax=Olea europaea subsp. europaea TaxID=158383 RepID=A0A8S0PW06_OLEEU|nr:LRR receptor-like serine threonine- kinase GSO1 [Olea europaea subsp. europaea]